MPSFLTRKLVLWGMVKFHIGGIAREAAKLPEQVRFLCRRYSPDEKRKDLFLERYEVPRICVGIFYLVLIMNTSKRSLSIKKISALAIFSALSYLSLYVFRIPGIGGFLTFDIKDTIVCLAAMIFGPISGAAVSLLVALIEMVTVSGTGPWGFLMNFLSTAAFASVASAVYMYIPKVKKTMKGAILGLLTAILASTVLMLILNIFVTPVYLGVPRDAVLGMLIPLLLPFNFLKYVLNAAVVLVLYKPIKEVLRKTKFIKSASENYKFDKKSLLLTVCGLVIIVVCLLIFIFVMDGNLQFFKK